MTVIIKTPGGEISYKVPVIKMQKYSLEEIFKKNLLFTIASVDKIIENNVVG